MLLLIRLSLIPLGSIEALSDVRKPQAVVSEALSRVLRLLSVGSKRFLTTKVDRSVTGLIAQQQCVGPLHIPLADYAIIAQSYEDLTGGVTAIGEQPIKGLISPQVRLPNNVFGVWYLAYFGRLGNGADVCRRDAHQHCLGKTEWFHSFPFLT